MHYETAAGVVVLETLREGIETLTLALITAQRASQA